MTKMREKVLSCFLAVSLVLGCSMATFAGPLPAAAASENDETEIAVVLDEGEETTDPETDETEATNEEPVAEDVDTVEKDPAEAGDDSAPATDGDENGEEVVTPAIEESVPDLTPTTPKESTTRTASAAEEMVIKFVDEDTYAEIAPSTTGMVLPTETGEELPGRYNNVDGKASWEYAPYIKGYDFQLSVVKDGVLYFEYMPLEIKNVTLKFVVQEITETGTNDVSIASSINVEAEIAYGKYVKYIEGKTPQEYAAGIAIPGYHLISASGDLFDNAITFVYLPTNAVKDNEDPDSVAFSGTAPLLYNQHIFNPGNGVYVSSGLLDGLGLSLADVIGKEFILSVGDSSFPCVLAGEMNSVGEFLNIGSDLAEYLDLPIEIVDDCWVFEDSLTASYHLTDNEGAPKNYAYVSFYDYDVQQKLLKYENGDYASNGGEEIDFGDLEFQPYQRIWVDASQTEITPPSIPGWEYVSQSADLGDGKNNFYLVYKRPSDEPLLETGTTPPTPDEEEPVVPVDEVIENDPVPETEMLVQTGDMTPLALLAGLSAASAAALVACLIRRKMSE